MSREGPRYEPLPTAENDDSEVPACSHVEQDDPPTYQDVAGCDGQDQPPVNASAEAAAPPMPPPTLWGYKPTGATSFVPPSYKAATTLPSYKDVEIEKEQEARMEVVDQLFGLNRNHDEPEEPQYNGVVIGNDCLFFFAFLVAFFFNWIGLFIGYFIMYNLAGRYGAMAGFGFSMIKWLAYLRYSDCCQDYYMNHHIYLYWICNTIAFILVLKGVISWLSVRRYRYLNYPEQSPEYGP